MRVGVIGAGGWGTALAVIMAEKGFQVSLWVRNSDLYKSIILKRINGTYLPGIRLPERIRPTTSLADAARAKELLIMAVPSQALRSIASALRDHLSYETVIVSAAKGLETGTLLRLSQVLQQELPERYRSRIAVLSGPNHAEEVSRNIPTATVVAAAVQEIAETVQEALMTPFFRVYTNPDLIGVEMGGALKNVIALGAGILAGLKMGDNTTAALITRGLVEITRLGTAMGARARTFTGLSGLGDLFVTCTSAHSRNRAVGIKLAQGQPIDQVLAGMPMVAEGVTTTRAAYRLAVKLSIEMPITYEIYQVLYGAKAPGEALQDLMLRERKGEIEEIVFEK